MKNDRPQIGASHGFRINSKFKLMEIKYFKEIF